MFDEYGIDDPNPGREGKYTHTEYGSMTFTKSSFLKEWIDEYVGTDINVIMDIGALDGGDSLRLNSWYKDTKTYSIEGSPHNYRVMTKKIGDRPNLNMFNYVMTSENGEVDFHRTVYKDDRTESGYMVMGTIYTLKESKKRMHNLQSVDSVRVESVNFDTFCEMNGITEVDVVHVDIEGATYDMILGMNNVLPKLIFTEQEGKEFFEDKINGGNSELKELLNQKGYDLIKDLGNDFLFVRRDIL